MSLRSSLPRGLAITAAVASLLAAAAAAPAVADGEWDNGDPNSGQSASATASDQPGGSNQSGTWNPNANSQSADNQASNPQSGNTQGVGNGNQTANTQGGNTQGGDNGNQTANAQGGDWDQHGNQNNQRLYRGRVTASTLALRAAPNRGGQVIRYAHRGEIVSIFCKTGGQNVDGNRLWYLLTDGTWAWGAARYIDNIGAAPRWC
ncbi:SH3 domain-containing protein [Streptomyces sp. NPDC087903]|uniref:SH3 domain-containing protein n=1 Tax=Streptomyces sp. NPDC087903 TaxID=3365819 RepID=UPI00380F79E6